MPFFTPEDMPTTFICRRLRIPESVGWLSLVNGVLSELTKNHNFVLLNDTDLSVQQTVDYFTQMFMEYLEGEPCLLGSIIPYATQDAPDGTLPCDGSTHLRVDHPRLYAALDPVYVIDADSFATPDLQGRNIIGTGTGTGLSTRDMGDKGGEESHVLIVGEMPTHSHSTQPHSHTDSGHTHFVPIPTFLAVEPGEAPTYTPLGFPAGGQTSAPGFASIVAETVVVNDTGDGDGHENMPPFHALRYCIVAR